MAAASSESCMCMARPCLFTGVIQQNFSTRYVCRYPASNFIAVECPGARNEANAKLVLSTRASARY